MISEQLKYFIEQLNIVLEQEDIGKCEIKESVSYDEENVEITYTYFVNEEPRFTSKAKIPIEMYSPNFEEIEKEINDDFYRNLLMRTSFVQKPNLLELNNYQLN